MLLETAATSCLFSKKCACIVGICTQEEEGCTQNSNSRWQKAAEFIEEVSCEQHCWNWGGKWAKPYFWDSLVVCLKKKNERKKKDQLEWFCPLRWTWSKMTGPWSTLTTLKFRPLYPPTPLPSRATLRPSSWQRCFPVFSVSWEQTAWAACVNWQNSSLGKVGTIPLYECRTFDLNQISGELKSLHLFFYPFFQSSRKQGSKGRGHWGRGRWCSRYWSLTR